MAGELKAREQTDWAQRQREEGTQERHRAARRSTLAGLTGEGWQPIFTDPRERLEITDRMLEDYEILALSDIWDAAGTADGGEGRYRVTAVYEAAKAGTTLLPAQPLLVRARRPEAAPLATGLTGTELNELLTAMAANEEALTDYYEGTHYWCSTFAGRNDAWQMAMPMGNGALGELGALVFNPTADGRAFCRIWADADYHMEPMSYCLTAYDQQTLEELPLEGDRIGIAVYGYDPQPDPTGIDGPDADRAAKGCTDGSAYNLQGQRVDDSYRGIVVRNGRKLLKR